MKKIITIKNPDDKQKSRLMREFVSAPLNIGLSIEEDEMTQFLSEDKSFGLILVEGDSIADTTQQIKAENISLGKHAIVAIKSTVGYELPIRHLTPFIELLSEIGYGSDITWGYDCECAIDANIRISILYTINNIDNE